MYNIDVVELDSYKKRLMPKGKPDVNVIYRSAGMAINPPICIPVKKYREKYFLSLYQIKRLLAKNAICGIRFKRRLFIADIPPPVE